MPEKTEEKKPASQTEKPKEDKSEKKDDNVKYTTSDHVKSIHKNFK